MFFHFDLESSHRDVNDIPGGLAVVNKCAIIRCNQGLLSHHHHHRKIDDLRQVGFGLCFLRRKCFKQRGAARLWRREHLLADQLKRSQRWCRVIVITPRQRQLEQSVALRLQACTVEGGVLYQHNINQQPCRAGARQSGRGACTSKRAKEGCSSSVPAATDRDPKDYQAAPPAAVKLRV